MPREITVGAGGQWVQSEKDTVVSGNIPVGTPADTWVTVASVNEECLVLYAAAGRNANSNGVTSIRIIRDGVDFGESSSSTPISAAIVGGQYNYSINNAISGENLTLHCKQSLEIQVKNSVQTASTFDGLYYLSFSRGEML